MYIQLQDFLEHMLTYNTYNYEVLSQVKKNVYHIKSFYLKHWQLAINNNNWNLHDYIYTHSLTVNVNAPRDTKLYKFKYTCTVFL